MKTERGREKKTQRKGYRQGSRFTFSFIMRTSREEGTGEGKRVRRGMQVREFFLQHSFIHS